MIFRFTGNMYPGNFFMKTISLQELLEAGCHFGHKAEKWNPQAREFIYTEKDGIHIIDLVKTKEGLEKAVAFVRDLVARGDQVLFVATKRQAKGTVKEAAQKMEAPYFTERWIGGFLTNWDGIKKNIDKMNRMQSEKDTGSWEKFPKHEQMKLTKSLNKLFNFYGGVHKISQPPQAVFVVDVKKEISAVREAQKVGLPIIAIVDTNSDPRKANYPIPANDDAVGSVKLIMDIISEAYLEGKKSAADTVPATGEKKSETKPEVAETGKKTEAKTKKAKTVKPVTDKKPAAAGKTQNSKKVDKA